MRISTHHLFKRLALVCACLVLSACAVNTVKTDSIEYRAQERWDKLFSGDLQGAYEYLSPGFRSSVSSLAYQRSVLTRAIRYTSAEYKSSECDESTCKVTMRLGFSVSGALPGVKSYDGEKDIVESWVRIDGVWYHVP